MIERALRWFVRRGLRDGLLGGSYVWLVLGAIAFVVRIMRKPEPKLVYSERLPVGGHIEIHHLPAPPRGRAKRLKRRRARRGSQAITDGPSDPS